MSKALEDAQRRIEFEGRLAREAEYNIAPLPRARDSRRSGDAQRSAETPVINNVYIVPPRSIVDLQRIANNIVRK